MRPFDEISGGRHETVTSVADTRGPIGSNPQDGMEGTPSPPETVLRQEGSFPLMPLRRLVASIALMAAVVLLTFTVLVASGRLDVVSAAAAFVTIVVVHTLLLRAFLDGLTRIRAGVDE